MRPAIIALVVLAGLFAGPASAQWDWATGHLKKPANGKTGEHQNNPTLPPPEERAGGQCFNKRSTIYKERVYLKSYVPPKFICVGKCQAEMRGVQWKGDEGTMAFVYTGKSCD